VRKGRLAKLLQSNKTAEEILDELFLATLSRFPSKEEKEHFARCRSALRPADPAGTPKDRQRQALALQKEREQYRDQSLRLSEAILYILKTSTGGDAQARMDVETQLRSLNELIAKADNPPAETATLMDGNVISVKDEWSLVVGNIGEKHGVKMGMPMRVMRGDKVIATLRVVDVRQRICGAVIQKMDSEKEKIKVGDRLQADARRDVSLK
jgi:hypothetical protein